jgi:hypothetical protein
MIAAGSLVYTYFTKKWQGAGLPMLPVAALGAGAGQGSPFPPPPAAQQPSQQPVGGLPGGTTFHRATPKGSSFMDEYEV